MILFRQGFINAGWKKKHMHANISAFTHRLTYTYMQMQLTLMHIYIFSHKNTHIHIDWLKSTVAKTKFIYWNKLQVNKSCLQYITCRNGMDSFQASKIQYLIKDVKIFWILKATWQKFPYFWAKKGYCFWAIINRFNIFCFNVELCHIFL